MARGRMLSHTIAEDVEFNGMSMEAQLIFLRTIPHLDRDGLTNGHPTILWGKVAPLMPDLLPQMQSVINEWATSGLVVSYTDNKTAILYFKGFTKNQIGMRYEREPASIFPPPPGYHRNGDGLSTGNKIEQPPSSDGNNPQSQNEDKNQSRRTSGELPANFRQLSVELPADCRPNRIEENRIEENTRETHAGVREQPPPVFENKPPTQATGDPFMDAAKAKFERSQNGNGNHGYAQDWQIELNRRMPARDRLVMAELVARLFGLSAKLNSDDKTLEMVHKQAVVLFETGHDTPEKVEALHAVWMADEWRKKNPDKLTVYKFTDFASLKAQEMKAKATKQRKEVVIFNQYTNQRETKVVYQ